MHALICAHRALIALLLALAASSPALAQGGGAVSRAPTVQQLIEQLRPDGDARGIRLPTDPPAEAGTRPAVPQGRRSAAAATRPAPGTTAPPGVPAASLTVLFATGSAALMPEAERLLDVLGEALASPALSAYRFRIEGHTDTVGTPEANLELSQRRAAAVRDYLTRRFGLPEARLEAVGLGEGQPLIRTPDGTPEQRNRRVQVINLGT